MDDILSLTAAADVVQRELGATLGTLALEQARERGERSIDLSRRGLRRAAVRAARDARHRLSLERAETPLAAQAVYLAGRLEAGTIEPAVVFLDDAPWSDAAVFVAHHRPEFLSVRAAKFALARRAELEQERVTLAARNPSAAAFEDEVQLEAGRRGLLRPTPSSSAEHRAAWWNMVQFVAGRNKSLAAAAQGRRLADDGRMTPPSTARTIVLDKLGRLVRTPPAA